MHKVAEKQQVQNQQERISWLVACRLCLYFDIIIHISLEF